MEQTFLAGVRGALAAGGDRPALTFLTDGEIDGAETWSFADLDLAARTVAADLQSQGVQPGDRVLLLLAPGWHFQIGFLGCVYAGAIAVPAYAPSPFMGKRGAERLAGMWTDAGAIAALTTSALLPLVRFLGEEFPELKWVLTDKPGSDAAAFKSVEVTPGDLVFLQYTSGSTTSPRGVRVTNSALMANIIQIIETWGLNKDTIGCAWLPPFHDMGLISMLLTPMLARYHSVQMSPESFLRRPERWLRAITHFHGTFAWAPNFAYEQCVRRIKDLSGLDLSSWQVAGSGSEPVRERTLAQFAEKFGACGLREDSLYVGYGLAEATLLLTTRRRGPGSTMWADPDQLAAGRLVPVDPAAGRPVVSCGRPVVRTNLTIRDPETGEPVEDGVMGEIVAVGPQVCDGYWGRPELSAELYRDYGLRSGDLGVLREGELYVTGRRKDLLIVRGRNHYPQDIEQTMDSADPEVRHGCGVAVSVPSDTGERLVLIQEVEAHFSRDPQVIVENIRRSVVEQHGVTPDTVVLARPRMVPKTTSGKLMRSAASAAYQAGRMRVVHEWSATV